MNLRKRLQGKKALADIRKVNYPLCGDEMSEELKNGIELDSYGVWVKKGERDTEKAKKDENAKMQNISENPPINADENNKADTPYEEIKTEDMQFVDESMEEASPVELDDFLGEETEEEHESEPFSFDADLSFDDKNEQNGEDEEDLFGDSLEEMFNDIEEIHTPATEKDENDEAKKEEEPLLFDEEVKKEEVKTEADNITDAPSIEEKEDIQELPETDEVKNDKESFEESGNVSSSFEENNDEDLPELEESEAYIGKKEDEEEGFKAEKNGVSGSEKAEEVDLSFFDEDGSTEDGNAEKGESEEKTDYDLTVNAEDSSNMTNAINISSPITEETKEETAQNFEKIIAPIKEEIENIKERLSELEKNKSEENVRTVPDENKNNEENDVKELKSSMKKVKEELAMMNAMAMSNSQLLEEDGELTSELFSSLEGKVDSLKEDIILLKEEKEEQEKRFEEEGETESNLFSETEIKIDSINEEVNAQKERADEMKSLLDKELIEMHELYSHLMTDVSALKEESETRKEVENVPDEKAKEQENKIISLEENASDISGKIDDLSEKAAVTDGEIENLNAKIADLEKRLTKVQKENESLKAVDSENESDIIEKINERLDALDEQADFEKSKNEEEILLLRKKNEELESEIERLKKNDSPEEELIKIKNKVEVEAIKSSLIQAENSMKALYAKCSALEESIKKFDEEGKKTEVNDNKEREDDVRENEKLHSDISLLTKKLDEYLSEIRKLTKLISQVEVKNVAFSPEKKIEEIDVKLTGVKDLGEEKDFFLPRVSSLTAEKSGKNVKEDAINDNTEMENTEEPKITEALSLSNVDYLSKNQASEKTENYDVSKPNKNDLREDVREVLSYMDGLLESLPEEKMKEFARSEHFIKYKKLFSDLNLT